jgi:CheY-like chemotaxis protein
MTTRERTLAGRRVLVAEDVHNIAMGMVIDFEAYGAEIVGPAGTVEDALALIASGERIDGAVLDINLRGEPAYPVADALRRKGVPIVFMTGYDKSSIALPYADVPSVLKPAPIESLVRALFGRSLV